MFDEDNSGEIDMQASKKEIKIFAFFCACVCLLVGYFSSRANMYV